MGTSDDEAWDESIFKLKVDIYYYISENIIIKVTEHD